MFRMITYRVKKLLAWVIAILIVVLLFSGAYWLVTTFA